MQQLTINIPDNKIDFLWISLRILALPLKKEKKMC